jgi:hypothetical protein
MKKTIPLYICDVENKNTEIRFVNLYNMSIETLVEWKASREAFWAVLARSFDGVCMYVCVFVCTRPIQYYTMSCGITKEHVLDILFLPKRYKLRLDSHYGYAHGQLTVREYILCLSVTASIHSNGHAYVTGSSSERGCFSKEYSTQVFIVKFLKPK